MEQVSIQELCSGYPDEFAVYIGRCRALHFTERPDYAALQRLFEDILSRIGPEVPSPTPWSPRENTAPEYHSMRRGYTIPSLEPLEPWKPVMQPDDGLKPPPR